MSRVIQEIDLTLATTSDNIIKIDNADVINISIGVNIVGILVDDFVAEVKLDVEYLNSVLDTDAFITIASGNDSLNCLKFDQCNLDALILTSPGGSMIDEKGNSHELGEASEFTDNTIVVGALKSNGIELTDYSNRAGILGNHFISAPVLTTDDGTSFSAPLVAGLGVLLADKFENLSGSQIKQRILTTGDDLGAPGVDAIFGYGKINVSEALSPQM